MGRIVGLDYGTARIGIAISDESKMLARSLATLQAEKKLELSANKLLEALAEYQIDGIVLGHPLKMNNTKGPLSDEVHAFAELLRSKTSCPVILWDERLTTVQAERVLRESNMTRKQRSKAVDAVTAIIILQNYLDSLHFHST